MTVNPAAVPARQRPAREGVGALRRSPGERLFDAFNVALLTGLVLITLYPFYYVLVASLSDPVRLSAHEGLLLWPQGFSADAYARVWTNPLIRSGYANTLIYVVGGTLLNMVLTCFGAYALSRPQFGARRVIMLLIVFTLFFSGGLIPMYLLVKNLGMLDTRWAVILPTAISAWNLIVLRTAFMGVPESLPESARMDGANDFTILWRIYVPLTLPSIAVIGLFYAVGHWNAYFDALIYFSSRDLFPLQLVLRELLVASDTSGLMTGAASDREPISATIKYATIVTSTLPILVLYPFLQRYFVKGVMIGGIKE